MKKLILFLLVFNFSWVFVYSQNNEMTIKNLESLTNMNTSQLEDWSLKNGYEFVNIVKYDDFDVIYYKKKEVCSISFGMYKDGTADGSIQYQTINNTEYSNLKTNCTKYGYKHISSTPFNNDNKTIIFHIYQNENFELSFNTSNKETYYGFSIGIKKR